MVPHGSVTGRRRQPDRERAAAPRGTQLSIIEYTHRHTTLGLRGPGDRVHVEGDVVGKYVRRLAAPYLAAVAAPAGAAAPT
jgi:riboflavin synthase